MNDIARASSIEPSKLGITVLSKSIYVRAKSGPTARILRTLATNHIFVEVEPDVFANNRISSCLDTGKSVGELIARLAYIWFCVVVSYNDLRQAGK